MYAYNHESGQTTEEELQHVLAALTWFVKAFQEYVDKVEADAPDSEAQFAEAMKRAWQKEAEAGNPGKTPEEVDRAIAISSLNNLDFRIKVLETAKMLVKTFTSTEPTDMPDNLLRVTVVLFESVIQSTISSPNLEEADHQSLVRVLSLMVAGKKAILIGDNVLGTFDPLLHD